MHQPKAVGKLVAYHADDKTKRIWVGAKISRTTDGEDAWRKVKEKVLNGFSIGAPMAERVVEYRAGKPVRRVVNYDLSELSLVDNPACPEAFFTEVKVAKAAGEAVEVSSVLERFEGDPFEKSAEDEITPNAFIDKKGQIWRREAGVVKRVTVGNESKILKESEMSDLEKSGKKIGAEERPTGKAPGVEVPKVQGDPEPKQVLPKKSGAGDTEGGERNTGDAGGPHEIASKPAPEPDMQGKAAGDMMPGQQQQAPGQMMPGQMAPRPPAPAPAPAMRYNYCAMCGAKQAAAGASPVHEECAAKAADVQKSDVADELKKVFASGLEAFQKTMLAKVEEMSSVNARLVERIERIEKTPLPGGPARTELPAGVRPVEKGAGAIGKDDLTAEIIEKAASFVSDPFTRDKMLQEATRLSIKKAQSGRTLVNW